MPYTVPIHMHITRCPIGLPKEYAVSACLPFVSGSDRVHLNKCLDNRRRGVARSVALGPWSACEETDRDTHHHPPSSGQLKTTWPYITRHQNVLRWLSRVLSEIVNRSLHICIQKSNMKFLINFVSTNQPTTTTPRRRGQQHGGTFQRDIWWAAAAAGESQSDGQY